MTYILNICFSWTGLLQLQFLLVTIHTRYNLFADWDFSDTTNMAVLTFSVASSSSLVTIKTRTALWRSRRAKRRETRAETLRSSLPLAASHSQSSAVCLRSTHLPLSAQSVGFILCCKLNRGAEKNHWSLHKISTLKQLKSKFYRQPLGGRLLSTVGCLFMLFHPAQMLMWVENTSKANKLKFLFKALFWNSNFCWCCNKNGF